ncbi:hypothetical protein [Cellulophaga fucicola]|uniref:Uncharacterized protein n=1 Tax=Cellulophaga fucicola TaxID=76595 RepID=A0A1K1QK79_9FLAO|nr:hypothetical protein [Cellulophaga fucicola]SFW60330.1 hypothetical protein SAMN05660313_02730 [Cellulophaga fucicola]
MKYNLTSESALSLALKNYPTISDWSFWSIIQTSAFYNLTTIIVSLLSYFPIVYMIKKLVIKKHKLRTILTGFALTITTPIYYLILQNWRHNDYYLPNAELISWILCFILSMGIYYLFNNKNKDRINYKSKI